jgi:chloride channel 7
MTTYWTPAATGSGVAELIGYLNGVNYPGWLDMKVLVTKMIGVVFAVCARLAVGKEGPLAHIGSIVGVIVLYLPGFGFEFLRNDE